MLFDGACVSRHRENWSRITDKYTAYCSSAVFRFLIDSVAASVAVLSSTIIITFYQDFAKIFASNCLLSTKPQSA